MGAKEGAGGLSVRLPSISWVGEGAGVHSNYPPSSLGLLGLVPSPVLSPTFPQCPLPFTVPTLAPTAHVLSEMTLLSPQLIWWVPVMPGVALKLSLLPSQVGRISGVTMKVLVLPNPA